MQRSKAFQSTLFLLVLACATVFALSARSPEDPKAPTAAPKPTTIVLVRHAEKDPQGDARDPGLSAEGKARAERLAKMLAAAGVTNLYATEFHRTQDTLAPLAALVKGRVEVTPGAKTADLQKTLDALPAGSIAVVAGHSNTVPAIAAHFGVELPGLEKTAQGMMMPESAFDRVYVLTLPAKESKSPPALLELRY
jgi:phosphohistidine phosphatase SixA